MLVSFSLGAMEREREREIERGRESIDYFVVLYGHRCVTLDTVCSHNNT